MLNRTQKTRAFTLVEAAVTTAVIGILAAAGTFAGNYALTASNELAVETAAASVAADIQHEALFRSTSSQAAIAHQPWVTNPVVERFTVTPDQINATVQITSTDAVACIRFPGVQIANAAPGTVTKGPCA